MPDPETIGKTAELTGSTVAMACGLCRWLVVNHDLIAIMGMFVGASVAVAGFIVNWYYQQQRLKNEVRQRTRRHQR